MNKFIAFWSLASPICLSIVASVLWFYKLVWHPAYFDIWRSIAVYFAYWLLLGLIQGAILFWKLQERRFAYQWFFVTSAVGFSVMLLHDLSLLLLGADTRGQGALILLLSLPLLAILGGLPLGLAQFFLIRNRYRANLNATHLNLRWFALSFLSWVVGFIGILFIFSGTRLMPILLLFVAAGTAIKGWFLQKYLRN
jgi:hypothetical protein